MNRTQRKAILGSIAIAVLCWVTAPIWGKAGGTRLPVSQARTLFDQDAAFRTTREFVTQNPRRVMGSLQARQASGYIMDRLTRQGYQVNSAYFDAVISGRRQVGSNILAFKPGQIAGIIGVVAHYDTTRTTFQGATDDGSGIGVLLELARVFAVSPLSHSLLVIASDGEEWGMLGANEIAAGYPNRARIEAVLSLDYVAPGEVVALQLDADGQRSGYAPRWLRQLALRCAMSEGLPVIAPSGLEEDIQRAFALSRSDQGPFLHAGIPAINLGSVSSDPAQEMEIYHTPNDTIDNLNPSSFQKYGKTAERIIRSLDGLSEAPARRDNAFCLHDDSFIAGWVVAILAHLAFLPFLVMLGFAWVNFRRSLSIEGVLREASFCFAWFAPFALFYSLILFCRLMRVVPGYSLYPGPFRDPTLESPAWGAIAIVVAVAAGFGIGLHFLVRYLMRRQPRPAFGSSKLTLMIFLLPPIGLTLHTNAFWAMTFLTLPSLIWGLAGQGKTPVAKALGAIAIVAAGLELLAVAVFSARSVGLGWDVLWYAVLGLSTGMFRWQGYFLTAAVIALGLRFLALQLAASQEPSS